MTKRCSALLAALFASLMLGQAPAQADSLEKKHKSHSKNSCPPIFDHGKVHEVGDPKTQFSQPRTAELANFIGSVEQPG